MARRRTRRISMRVTQNVSSKLAKIDLGLKGAAVDAGLLEAADYLAGIARRRAPRKTGTLQAGIYTANSYRNNHPGLRQVTKPKYPARPGQALIVGGAFYQKWVEYGRKAKAGPARKGAQRGVGRMRRRPFFRQAIQSGLPGARAMVAKKLQRIIEESA